MGHLGVLFVMIYRTLGHTGIRISPIGLGCMQFSGAGQASVIPIEQPGVDAIVKAAVDGGITWFDTAEAYGHGRSERALSSGLTSCGVKPGDVTIATKWAPLGRTARSITRTIDDRLRALNPFPVDLHQIHMPYGSFSPLRAQARAMARLAETHRIGAIGVSKFSARQMELTHAELAKHGIALASNQVQINLLHRKVESNGVLDTARRLGVTLIAYSPLRSGILTAKFHDDPGLVATMPRRRRTLFAGDLDRSAPLIDGLRQVALKHSATVGQVALAWLTTYYGDTVVAIPGATKPHHAEEAAGAMRIALSEQETQTLALLASQVGG
ncbi:aldo/keto reductase [Mycobacterium sp.]|uniref:aldo/keto reductase n=1 Tax=Mycobacterium sp. TaxID=1785 RepID=UPI002C842CD4|nr:aldo/keto reductase [Mycobacterium sp.]HTY30140.1 aldo/keto reductase [Mycobacterium sp.]